MHCLLKWIDTESSKQQCPLDRRPWGKLMACGTAPCCFHIFTALFQAFTHLGGELTPVNADRKPDKLPTTMDGAPMQTLAPGPVQTNGDGQ